MRREEKSSDRYDTSRNSKFMDFISKEIADRNNKQRGSRLLSNKQGPSQINSSDIYSQPQIIRQRRGASLLRANSKSKYADSMSKFRKDFIKDTSFNFYQGQKVMNDRKTVPKDQTLGLNIENDLDIQQLHYHMVKLNQNVRKMHGQT